MKFIYSLIHNSLTRNHISVGTFNYNLIRVLIQKATIGRTSFKSGSHMIYLEKLGIITYICVSEEDNLQMAFQYLQLLQDKYEQNSATTQNYMKVNMEFNLQTKTEQIKGEIGEIKQQMHTNIDELLKRGELLEDIVSKAQQLEKFTFQIKQKFKEEIIEHKQVIVKESIYINERKDDSIFWTILLSNLVVMVFIWVKYLYF